MRWLFTDLHDVIPTNIAKLASFTIAFVNSSSLLSKSLKTLKGWQEKIWVFRYLSLYPCMTVGIEMNLLLLASCVGSLLKFYLEVFSTLPMVDLEVPAS